MYEITLLNEKGQKFMQQFDSEYFFEKALKKFNHSKRLTVVSYGKEV